MKWLGIAVALLAISSCLLEVVQGTAFSPPYGATSSGSTSSGTLASGTTTGAAVNGASASGGSSSGNGTSGGTTAGSVNGGSSTGGGIGSSSGGANGGTTTGGGPTCDAGLTFCSYVTLGGETQGCFDTSSDDLNCGTCDNDCATSYGTGSSCGFGICSCDEPQQQLCTDIPSGSPLACDCVPAGPACASPSFATDVYPFLAQQKGLFGCAASGCHSGATPAAELAFLDPVGELDAGMAYAELIGSVPGVASVCPDECPRCDAGVVSGDPAYECSCVSRVVAGNIYQSYLIDVLANDLPGACSTRLPMPTDGTNWLPLSGCQLQLVEQWVATGAGQ